MHLLIKAGVAVVAVAGMNSPAHAQGDIRPNERYCLQVSEPQSAGGLLCRYETRVQCEASKTGPSDSCFPNPVSHGRR